MRRQHVAMLSESRAVLSPRFAYDQSVRTVARFATWLDAVATAFLAVVLRGVAAVLAFGLRRGKHRSWRHGETSGPSRSDESRV